MPGAYCANATASVLKKIPGFEDIKVTFYPVKLAEQIAQVPGVTETRYYENDSADLQVGLARNNAILNGE